MVFFCWIEQKSCKGTRTYIRVLTLPRTYNSLTYISNEIQNDQARGITKSQSINHSRSYSQLARLCNKFDFRYKTRRQLFDRLNGENSTNVKPA